MKKANCFPGNNRPNLLIVGATLPPSPGSVTSYFVVVKTKTPVFSTRHGSPAMLQYGISHGLEPHRAGPFRV